MECGRWPLLRKLCQLLHRKTRETRTLWGGVFLIPELIGHLSSSNVVRAFLTMVALWVFSLVISAFTSMLLALEREHLYTHRLPRIEAAEWGYKLAWSKMHPTIVCSSFMHAASWERTHAIQTGSSGAVTLASLFVAGPISITAKRLVSSTSIGWLWRSTACRNPASHAPG
jgi:hypothetical protein